LPGFNGYGLAPFSVMQKEKLAQTWGGLGAFGKLNYCASMRVRAGLPSASELLGSPTFTAEKRSRAAHDCAT